MEWPVNSPDLNPIEHLWDEVGQDVRRRVTDQTEIADLRELLMEEGDVIPQQRVRTHPAHAKSYDKSYYLK